MSLDALVHADHVEDGHAFGDGDDDVTAGVDGFEDGVGGEGGGDEDHGGVRAFFFDGFVDGVEDGDAERGLAAFAGRDAGDEFGAVVDAIFGVELAGFAGDALADYAGGFVDQDAHGWEALS